MFKSLGTRLGLVHIVYLMLLSVAVGSMTLVLVRQQDDGLVVNLSGRQRMLTQRITHQLLTYAVAKNHGESAQAERQAALTSMLVFEKTHDALTYGGPAPTDLELVTMRSVPAATPAVQAQMQRVGALWRKYSENARTILDGSVAARETAVLFVTAHNTELLREMNAAVTLMQLEGEKRIFWLFVLEGGTVVAGILVTLILSLVIHRSVVRPLRELNVASDSMSRGDVNRRIKVTGPKEIVELTASFERLRVAMKNLVGGTNSLPY